MNSRVKYDVFSPFSKRLATIINDQVENVLDHSMNPRCKIDQEQTNNYYRMMKETGGKVECVFTMPNHQDDPDYAIPGGNVIIMSKDANLTPLILGSQMNKICTYHALAEVTGGMTLESLQTEETQNRISEAIAQLKDEYEIGSANQTDINFAVRGIDIAGCMPDSGTRFDDPFCFTRRDPRKDAEVFNRLLRSRDRRPWRCSLGSTDSEISVISSGGMIFISAVVCAEVSSTELSAITAYYSQNYPEMTAYDYRFNYAWYEMHNQNCLRNVGRLIDHFASILRLKTSKVDDLLSMPSDDSGALPKMAKLWHASCSNMLMWLPFMPSNTEKYRAYAKSLVMRKNEMTLEEASEYFPANFHPYSDESEKSGKLVLFNMCTHNPVYHTLLSMDPMMNPDVLNFDFKCKKCKGKKYKKRAMCPCGELEKKLSSDRTKLFGPKRIHSGRVCVDENDKDIPTSMYENIVNRCGSRGDDWCSGTSNNNPLHNIFVVRANHGEGMRVVHSVFDDLISSMAHESRNNGIDNDISEPLAPPFLAFPTTSWKDDDDTRVKIYATKPGPLPKQHNSSRQKLMNTIIGKSSIYPQIIETGPVIEGSSGGVHLYRNGRSDPVIRYSKIDDVLPAFLARLGHSPMSQRTIGDKKRKESTRVIGAQYYICKHSDSTDA